VTLNDISLSANPSGLTLDAVAKTFRYLDDGELAAARKKPAAGAKK
jgi:type IV pilus assembly protein PilO